MISLRYGFLCEYAASDSLQKPTIVGIHDVYFTKALPGQIAIPKHYIHFRLDAHGDVSPRHLATLRLIDADANVLVQQDWALELAHRGEGLGYFANVHVHIDQPIPLPDYGQYNWVVMVDGLRLGEIPFSVVQLQEQKQQAPAT